jgi:Domain of unknown function (DUF4251)
MNKSTAMVKTFFLLLAFLPLSSQLSAQDSTKQQKQHEKEAAIKGLIDSKQFAFIPQSVRPMNASTRQVNGFDLILNKDTLQSHLPYIGRSFSASYGATDGGLDFTTSDFTYVASAAKKGGWDITITPKKIRDVIKMTFQVTESGYANLQVSSNTRQGISFSGYIQGIN